MLAGGIQLDASMPSLGAAHSLLQIQGHFLCSDAELV
jgi:hypothetical protein